MRRAVVLASLLVLAACAHAPSPKPHRPAPPPATALPPSPPLAGPSEPAPTGQPIALGDLPGWNQENHAAAFAAYQRTCSAAKAADAQALCQRARAVGPLDEISARLFLEANFEAWPAPGTGLLTAYFSPVYAARDRADDEFSAPVRPRPADLGSGPYADRAAIEARPAPDALAWMRPEDLFFLQIQGSGLLTFPDGRRMKAVYSATNGQPFVAIARPMRQQGLLSDDASGDAIRAWLAAHRGPAAQAVTNLDGRYVFFVLQPDDGQEPAGAAGVSLPAGRAIAIDPAFHDYGDLFWLDAQAPTLPGAFPTYRRLVTALDTGSAITGAVRADLYLGGGDAAGAEAGRVRHDLHLYRLTPKP